MRIISCIVEDHDLWLTALAAVVCLVGSFVTLRLYQRAAKTTGLQRFGWNFQTGVAAGASVWCTHFIAMLAYYPDAQVSFDPMLTFLSLVWAIIGLGCGFALAAGASSVAWRTVGGALVGLAIPVMHYVGMAAYAIDGIVEWDIAYVVASVVLSVALSVAAVHVASRIDWHWALPAGALLFVLAIVSLHFTGMAAMHVTPLATGGEVGNPVMFQIMALAVAMVAIFIVGTGIASYVIDADARSANILRLQHLALYDALTGLPNRTHYAEHLDARMIASKAAGTKLAIVGIDLNRFKEINDLRGHTAGDAALKIVAERLASILKDSEFVARVGGDEFGACKTFSTQTELNDFADRLERVLSEPVQVDDFRAGAGASIGVAIYPDDAQTRETLLVNADLAMYRAKADLTKSVCYYETKLDEAARERRSIALDLSRAIELGQLDLHYQVQTSVSTGETRGYEVLLRWHHPVRGLVPPVQFIPVAEETGSILSIGEWVLREACKRAVTWQTPYKIAVNLSPVQFAQAELPKLVHQILIETGLAPNRLELEITESAVIADKARALHILRQIRALGVTIALDDFGTGYSSLDTLRSFPFDKIKLDKLFMHEVERNPQSKAIVRAVLALGKSLDVPILAEGVETKDQLSILKHEGCDEAQGYLLGRPVPQGALFGAEDGPTNEIAATSRVA